MMGSCEEDEDMFFDSPEGLKRSRADLSARLHECRSARCLLPCGLLPEELEELKGFSTVVSNTTALIQVDVSLKRKLMMEDSGGTAAPLTPPSLEMLTICSPGEADASDAEDCCTPSSETDQGLLPVGTGRAHHATPVAVLAAASGGEEEGSEGVVRAKLAAAAAS